MTTQTTAISPGELVERRREAARLLVWAEQHRTTARPGDVAMWARRTANYRRTLADLDRSAMACAVQLDLFEVMV